MDAAAGLPGGSTSNYFRTRQALLVALVGRFSQRERTMWEELAARACAMTPVQLAATVAVQGQVATTGARGGPVCAARPGPPGCGLRPGPTAD